MITGHKLPSLSTAEARQIRKIVDSLKIDEPMGKVMSLPHGREALYLNVSCLPISRRASNALINEGLTFVGELVRYTEGQLLRLPNFGRVCLADVKYQLSRIELNLGTENLDWVAPKKYLQIKGAREHKERARKRYKKKVLGKTEAHANWFMTEGVQMLREIRRVVHDVRISDFQRNEIVSRTIANAFEAGRRIESASHSKRRK